MTTVVLEHLQHANSASPDLTVGPGGNIGIGGVAAPSADLEIKPTGADGELKITSDANGGNNMRLIQGYNSYINASNNVYISAGGNTDMFNLVNGNVGIGTANPDSVLHVVSQEIGTGSNKGIKLSNHNETKEYSIRTGVSGNENTTLSIYDETSSADRLVISTSGNVGIGTTSPGVPLDVTSSRSNVYSETQDQRSLAHIVARNGSDAAGRFASISLVNGGGTQAEGSINLVQTGNYLGDLAFKLRTGANSTDWRERLRIKSNGAVITPNSPAFDAYYTTNNTWSIGASNTLVFNATTFNRGGHYNTSNGRFTAPVSGVYHFTFYSIMVGNYTNGDLNLYVNGGRGNGTDRHFTIDTGSNWNTISGSNTRYLNAGDYVMVFTRSGADFHGGYWSNFSGHLVG